GGERGGNPGDLRVRALDRRTGSEASDDEIPPVVACWAQIRDQWNPRLDVLVELRRHHADDGERRPIQPYGSSDELRIAAVALRPDAVAEHDQRDRAAIDVDGREGTSEFRLDAERREIRGGGRLDRETHGLTAVIERHRAVHADAEIRKDRRPSAQVVVI